MEVRILKLLQFPRLLVEEGLELEDCPHAGMYDGVDRRCLDCYQGIECEWLGNSDAFSALEVRRPGGLSKTLEVSLCYVQAAIAEWGHDLRSCHCQACNWHREARNVCDQIRDQRRVGCGSAPPTVEV
jgi:hypothetical protein